MVLETDEIGTSNFSFHPWLAQERGEVDHLIKPLALSTEPHVPVLKHGFHHRLFGQPLWLSLSMVAVLPGCVIGVLCPGLFQSTHIDAGWIRPSGFHQCPPVRGAVLLLLFTS